MDTRCAASYRRSAPYPIGLGLRRVGTISTSIPTWLTADGTAAAVTRVYSATAGCTVIRRPHAPHYQAVDYNPLNGGIARWFEPIESDVGGGSTMGTILSFCESFFGALAPQVKDWHIEVHQFRIEARPAEEGRPTPEGLHRDGVDYVLVLLIQRRNIARGTTTIHATAGRTLGNFTLTDPFDAAVVDDSRVFHGVTPVRAIDPALPAYRDVLVVTFADEARRARLRAGA